MMKVKIGISMEEDLSKKLEELSQEMGELKISKSELVEAIDGIFQIVSRPQGDGEGTNYAEKEWKALTTICWVHPVHFLKNKNRKMAKSETLAEVLSSHLWRGGGFSAHGAKKYNHGI